MRHYTSLVRERDWLRIVDMAITSKSPQDVVRTALATVRRVLPPYRRACSAEFAASIVGLPGLKNPRPIRGVVAHLEDHPTLLALLELKFAPHFTTLQKPSRRCWRRTGRRCWARSATL